MTFLIFEFRNQSLVKARKIRLFISSVYFDQIFGSYNSLGYRF